MTVNLKSGYRIVFLIGLLLGFVSVFLDWYYFLGVTDSGEVVVNWVYNVFFDWSTAVPQGDFLNDSYEPKNASIPVAIVIVFLTVVFLSAYLALLLDAERKDNLPRLKKFGLANLSLMTLIGFFVLIYPIFFLLPNSLYYPFLAYNDYDLGVTFYYSIGPGYFLQLISFVCTFPYAIFNHSIINTFEKEKSSVENVVDRYFESTREDLDLDKLISQEEFKLESTKEPLKEVSKPKSKAEMIYDEYLTVRGRNQ